MKHPRFFTLIATLALFACEQPVERAAPQILLTLPHDTAAYTQGLVYSRRMLFESTGRRGHSTVRKVDPETGRVLLSRALPDSLFGEGLALVDSELVQLTWTSGRAFVYDTATLETRRKFSYEGEGWGLCYDGASLYMTNGSDSLYRRDPATFAALDAREVTMEGQPVPRLNELECVGEHVWANVWQENRLVQIEKATGHVVRDVGGLVLSSASGMPSQGDAVLNGIAYVDSTGVFFLTGKLWPKMFVVRMPEE